MAEPFGPKFAVSPSEWGAQKDYDAWADPWVPKTEIAVHYGGGPNTAGYVTGVFIPKEITRPKLYKYPWRWWKWYDSDEYALQLANEKMVLRAWENYHITGRGWRGIAYNFAIGQSGTLYRLRGRNNNGAHYTSDDIDYDGIPSNNESLAIVHILGQGQNPTRQLVRTFRKTRRWLNRHLGLILKVYGHREIAASGNHSTACPGVPCMNLLVLPFR